MCLILKNLSKVRSASRSATSKFLIASHEKLLKRPLNISGLLFILQTFFDKCVEPLGVEAQMDFLLALLQYINL